MRPRHADRALNAPVGCHLFADESKQHDYLFAVVVADPARLSACRSRMRTLVYAGNSRLHFAKERDSTRQAVVEALIDEQVRAFVVRAKGNSRGTRDRCIRAIAAQAGEVQASRLVLDLDQSVLAADRRLLAQAGLSRKEVEYQHLPSSQDPMLWIADALAWCEAREGRWAHSIRGLVTSRFEV